MAGAALALLGVAVLAIAVAALRHPGGHATSAGTVTATPKTTAAGLKTSSPATSVHPSSTNPGSSTKAGSSPATATSGAASKFALVILNNTTVTDLARQAEGTFEAGGWTVTSVGNYQNDIISTAAYYDPDVSGSQQAARALQAQFPAIKRVVPKFAGLPSGPIVVVLTPDYTSG